MRPQEVGDGDGWWLTRGLQAVVAVKGGGMRQWRWQWWSEGGSMVVGRWRGDGERGRDGDVSTVEEGGVVVVEAGDRPEVAENSLERRRKERRGEGGSVCAMLS
ncbi:hypothetical protein Tco_1479585 [Tanacetum coccineum]